jgi:hypothetical protein
MKISMTKTAALCLGLILASSLSAVAGENGKEPKSPKTYVLNDGTIHSNPGEMFQQLRDRDIENFASGNPKDIVDAYPEEFKNVGDLIDQKRAD